MGGGQEPIGDPVAEGRRIAEAAAQRRLPLRLLGGVAVALLCPSASKPPLARHYADIDLASVAAARDAVAELLEGLGYVSDKEFNGLHGQRRLLFWDGSNQRQVDVFLDEADLCHRIDLAKRIDMVPFTLSPTDLAVLKLQVIETNQKDYLDICALFADHELTFAGNGNGIDVAYIATLASADWGLWRTLGMVAERSSQFALDLDGFDRGDLVSERLTRLREELNRVPKTRGWKLRSRIGDRKRWYELPEEVQ